MMCKEVAEPAIGSASVTERASCEAEETRLERVLWLRERIRKGEYRIPAELIAESLIVFVARVGAAHRNGAGAMYSA